MAHCATDADIANGGKLNAETYAADLGAETPPGQDADLVRSVFFEICFFCVLRSNLL